MGRYRHQKYTWSKPFGSVRHNWELVGPKGAVNFHVGLTPGYEPSCGLEFHHTEQSPQFLDSYSDEAPHHTSCPLTGGRCWHDGTSLYASEHVWPLVEGYLRAGEHEQIFRLLEREADNRFHADAGDAQ